MVDVMKLAQERRTRAMSEIERLKDEVNRLNQFIRVGESLINQPVKGEKQSDPAAPSSVGGAHPPPGPGILRSGAA